MKKAGKVLLVILAVLALSAIIGWVAGPEAGASALLMMAVCLGAYFGAGWGGDHATKVEEYRQELLAKKKFGISQSPNNGTEFRDDKTDPAS